MQTINLTLKQDNSLIRVNPSHIIAYWNSADGNGSEVLLTISDFNTGVAVTQTADEIDELLEDV